MCNNLEPIPATAGQGVSGRVTFAASRSATYPRVAVEVVIDPSQNWTLP